VTAAKELEAAAHKPLKGGNLTPSFKAPTGAAITFSHTYMVSYYGAQRN
jgi:hypothetical protein